MTSHGMTHYLTLSNTNQFVFTCPVFDADTKMASCMALREAVWMGKFVEKRQGCQAAMRCSMCPAAEIVRKFAYAKGPVSDDYGSEEPKKGRLHADVLDRVVNAMPIESWIGRFNLGERERELLRSARERVAEQLKTAPGDGKKSTAFVEAQRAPKRKTAAPKPATPTPSAIERAAATGDMSAALNAA